MSECYVIEAAESFAAKPYYLIGRSKGLCFLLWDDNFDKALKFEDESKAHEWLKNNRIHCGFRIKKYAKQRSKTSIELRSNVVKLKEKKSSVAPAKTRSGVKQLRRRNMV